MLTHLCTLLLGSSILVNARCYDDGGNFAAAAWPYCTEASPNLSLYSGHSDDGQYVKLGVHIHNHTRGWSAVGFSGNGGMKGASQIVVRLEQDQWIAEDRYSLDYVTPSLDPQQDVRLIFAHDNGQNTSWAVIVPRDSCDVNDYAAVNVSRTFIWALGPSHVFVKHIARGQFRANILNGTQPIPALGNVTNLDIKMTNVSVVSATSDASNPYICGIFDLRQLVPDRNFTGKVHIAKFSPYLDPTTGPYLHHMILYGCDQSQANNFTHNSVIADCQSMPPGCTSFKWVWAVGSSDVQLPDNVGMPIGEGNYWIALQMHYYNPQQLPVRDSSGVTLALTPTLRSIDAGILQVNGGTSPSLRANLPANTARFELRPSLIVPATCTNTWQSPLNIVGAAHHMHLLGVHQQIEVSRNGTSLGLMRPERIYDFQHQSLEQSLISQLYPGDEIKLTCDYDTSNVSTPTQFGENTNNEMCWSAVMYYPAQVFSDAIILPVQPPAVRNASAQVCLSPAVNLNTSLYQLSRCAEVYYESPLSLGALLYSSLNVSASSLCNEWQNLLPARFAQLQRGWPNMCPPCHQNRNCTWEDLHSWGQSTVCPAICNATYQVSVWPDVSRQINPALNQSTYCGATPGIPVSFQDTFPSLPTCVRQGNLSNTSAYQQLVSGILADNIACPNADIKRVLTDCTPQDLQVLAGNRSNNCRDSCRNATSSLAAAFRAMSPVPNADQTVRCVGDYNRTWASTGSISNWTEWNVLDTRLRNGASICGDGADTTNGQYSAAPQQFTSWPMVTIALLSLACF